MQSEALQGWVGLRLDSFVVVIPIAVHLTPITTDDHAARPIPQSRNVETPAPLTGDLRKFEGGVNVMIELTGQEISQMSPR